MLQAADPYCLSPEEGMTPCPGAPVDPARVVISTSPVPQVPPLSTP
jgi:hypothetical protein